MMIGFGGVILLLLGVGVGAAVIVLLIAIRKTTSAASGETTCGKCGYAVTGLSTLTCPECGADFRTVGMLTPVQRAGWAPTILLVVWIVGSPLLICPVSGIIIALGPKVQQRIATIDFDQPPSQAYDGLRVEATSRALSRQFDGAAAAPPQERTFVFERLGAPNVTMVIETETGRAQFTIRNQTHTHEGDGIAASFTRWWNDNVYEVDEQQLRTEVEHAIEMTDEWTTAQTASVTAGIRTGGPLRVTGQGVRHQSDGHPAYVAAIVIAAAAIWITGIIWAVLLHARLRRSSRTSAATSSPASG
jgi:hypothetical protein